MEDITIIEVIPIFLALCLIFLPFIQMRIWKKRIEKENEEFGKNVCKAVAEQDKLSSSTTNNTEDK